MTDTRKPANFIGTSPAKRLRRSLMRGLVLEGCCFSKAAKLSRKLMHGSNNEMEEEIDVERIFDEETEELKNILKTQLESLRRRTDKKVLFSIFLDRYSCRKGTHLDVTLRATERIPIAESNSVVLLTSRIGKNPSAESLRKIVIEALEIFEFRLTDIISITTDGFGEMPELGDLLIREAAPAAFFHQQCFAHAINLGVINVLTAQSADVESFGNEVLPECDCRGEVCEKNCYEPPVRDRLEDKQPQFKPRERYSSSPPQRALLEEVTHDLMMQYPLYEGPIKKILNVVRIVLKVFQDHSFGEYLRHLRSKRVLEDYSLTTFCQTKYISILSMLKMFKQLEPELRTIYSNQEISFPVSKKSSSCIDNIVALLSIVEKCSKEICDPQTTFLQAHISLQKLLKKLEHYSEAETETPHDFNLATQLCRSISTQIVQRRSIASCLLHSLYSPHLDELEYLLAKYQTQKVQNLSPRAIVDEVIKFAPVESIGFPNLISKMANNLGLCNYDSSNDLRVKLLSEFCKIFNRQIRYENGASVGQSQENALFYTALENLDAIAPTCVPTEASFSESHISCHCRRRTLNTRRFKHCRLPNCLPEWIREEIEELKDCFD